MATERQIAANRANAAKSPGPVTPEGKRISSQNGSLHRLLSSRVVLKGESLRRYNAFIAAFIRQFQPRNAAEIALIQTMALARSHLLCARRSQTAALNREIARARFDQPSDTPRTTLIAIAFRTLAENSRSFARQYRLENHHDREYHRSLAKFLKLRQMPTPAHLAGEKGTYNFETEANLGTFDAHIPKSI
jgi:hypothetical protein